MSRHYGFREYEVCPAEISAKGGSAGDAGKGVDYTDLGDIGEIHRVTGCAKISPWVKALPQCVSRQWVPFGTVRGLILREQPGKPHPPRERFSVRLNRFV